MHSDNLYVQNLHTENFFHLGANDAELLSYALDEAGLLDDHTLIDGKSARTFLSQFYQKRSQLRQNSRLGNILISEGFITKEQLVQALTFHVDQDMPLGEALVQLQLCSAAQVEQALSKQAQLRRQTEQEE